jgi:hypothetical protein
MDFEKVNNNLDFRDLEQVKEECARISQHFNHDIEIAHIREDLIMFDFIKHLSALDTKTIRPEDIKNLKLVSKTIVDLYTQSNMKYYS